MSLARAALHATTAHSGVAGAPLARPLLAALLLHAALLALLLLELDELLKPGGRVMPPAAMTVMLLAAPRVATPDSSAEPQPQVQAEPIAKPQVQTPSKPPSKPPRAASAIKPATPQPAAASKAAEAPPQRTPSSEADAELADFLGNLRGRWLEPRGTPARFRCRLRIRYQAGGVIEAVNVESGCGSPELVDSIERAVWKSQPLPLRAARLQAGELSLEFSPP